MIQLEGIYHAYDGQTGLVPVVDGVDVQIADHEFVVLIGPSGCGKSTLLNLVAGIFPPTEGRVLYGGRPVTGVNTAVGYATQRDTLLPWRTMAGNISIALEIKGTPAAECERIVHDMVRKVGLAGFERHFPHQLSGGMRRRALIARTLIYSPESLLMDEPFGSLDAQNRLIMQGELLRLWQERRQTVMFVTHDLDEAIALADRILVFTNRPTRIKREMRVTIPRPRDVVAIRHLPVYQDAYNTLWQALHEEVAPLDTSPAEETVGTLVAR